MSAREEILARVRAALADAPQQARDASHGRAGDAPTPRAAEEHAVTVARFAERAAEYRATVRRAQPGGVADVVAEALAAHGARRVAVPAGLPPAWAPAGAELVADEQLTARQLDALDGVLTGCALAIAATGTLALDGGDPRCGRRALTLVPDLHVCVVEAAQVVADVPDALAALSPAAPLTLVSGPSATSDIELDRVEGVHGPRRLEIVLVG